MRRGNIKKENQSIIPSKRLTQSVLIVKLRRGKQSRGVGRDGLVDKRDEALDESRGDSGVVVLEEEERALQNVHVQVGIRQRCDFESTLDALQNAVRVGVGLGLGELWE